MATPKSMTKETLVKAVTPMDDLAIATDMLLSAKTAVRTYAVALTEAASPKVRKVLKAQLDTAIKTHQKIADYMIENEMYHPYDIDEQVEHDMKKSEIATKLVETK
ncbi:spore coat protein [Saccharibacillus alkalitolerans]|uniref:Spore coat protein n=1 Tax=Saccharibacillus alkalitolerans TaxID=2705290 RepID=A0ABX0FA86_9BACL|nr:spore coat protein [Saccharibacillus alkalitolerans]NGZ76884.1 spore coat protein [Saccharibacillus alkalitolerans]